MTVQEKIETREALIAELKKLNENCLNEKRELTQEERTIYDSKFAEIEKLGAEISAEKRENELNGFTTSKPEMATENRDSNTIKEFREYLLGERRALVADGENANGGALVPTVISDEIVKIAEWETPILAKSKVIKLNKAGSLGVIYESSDMDNAEFTSEIPASELSGSDGYAFGKRDLAPKTLLKLVKVSNKLIATAPNVENLVCEKLGYKFRSTIENSILNGSGTTQPLGLFKDTDITTIEPAGATISADDLISLKMKLKPIYRNKACFVMNTATLEGLMKLKDKNDNYIYNPANISLGISKPTLLGLEVIETPYAPNGEILLGDFDYCDVAIVSGDMSIKVLREKFADTNQTGFILSSYVDSMSVNKEAFVCLAADDSSSEGSSEE